MSPNCFRGVNSLEGRAEYIERVASKLLFVGFQSFSLAQRPRPFCANASENRQLENSTGDRIHIVAVDLNPIIRARIERAPSFEQLS